MMNIGLLGASRIARGAVIAPAAQMDDVAVASIAARDPARARAYAEAHGIANVADDYAALIADDDVNAVYVGLPPADHCRWSIAALRAGKHVLCEKPFAMNAAEAVEMVAAARDSGCVLLEAYHYRFHPAFAAALNMVRALGEVQSMRAHFNTPIRWAAAQPWTWAAIQSTGCVRLWARNPSWRRQRCIGMNPELTSQ